MSLESYHPGVVVPEHSVTVPWLVSRRSLYRYIPRKHFRMSAGNWPVLEFTCVGVTREFAFNFVAHPDSKLVGIQMLVDEIPIPTENAVPTELLRHLGSPRRRDTHIFRWWDDEIVVDCSVALERRQPHEPKVYSFSELNICYSAGLPFHWNHPEVRQYPPFPFPGHFKG